LAKTISGTAWDRLTVITVPVVRGSGAEIVGDLRIREMANVRFLNNAAWWTRSDMVVLTGYRDVSETFGPALARAIGDTAPLPFGLHGVEPVRATGEGPAAVWPTGEQPSGEQSALRGGGVLAALGYHGQNSD
jgi:hypothetical protein